MGSKVYFMDARGNSPQTSLVAKTATVFEAAGLESLITPGDTVAIKLHCGEWNNSAYLRPVYARTLADRIKELGGRPFVCDTTTLPYGPIAGRLTELDLLITAERNGFSSATLGCPFICADGFTGTDDYRVDIPEGYILKEAYIARAIAAADVLIVLTHFKGHPLGVIGGAVKNLGIGAQSKRGKFNVHMGGHPTYGFSTACPYHPEVYGGRNADKNWQSLEDSCPFGLIHTTEDSVQWNREKCTSCLSCIGAMAGRGIVELMPAHYQATSAAIADACLGTVKAVGADKIGYINLALDISAACDCVNYADVPILPHLGVFGSTDPVAIDKACIDKSIEAHGVHGSKSEEMGVVDSGERKFDTCSPLMGGLGEETQLNTGVIIGLGSMDYELVDVEPKRMADFLFPPDQRPTGIRGRQMFHKHPPFPYERHDGHGFAREVEVDLERVNTYRDAK